MVTKAMLGWVLSVVLALALVITVVSDKSFSPNESHSQSVHVIDKPVVQTDAQPSPTVTKAVPFRKEGKKGELRLSGVIEARLGMRVPENMDWEGCFRYFREEYSEQTFLTDIILTLWMEEDLDAVLAFMEKYGKATYQDWKTVGEHGARLAPDRMKLWIGQFTDQKEAQGLFAGYFGTLAEEDPIAAIVLFKSMGSKGSGDTVVLTNIYTRWSRHDFQAAFAHVMANEQGEFRLHLMGQLMNDHKGSLEEKRTLIDMLQGQERELVLTSVIHAMAAESPQQALEFYASFPPGEVGRFVLTSIFHGWASRDPMGALEAASKYGGGEMGNFQRVIIYQWANNDLDGLFAALRTGRLPLPNREVIMMALPVISRSPDRLLELISYAPNEDLGQILQRSTSALQHLSLEEINGLLNRLPSGAQQVDVIRSWIGNNDLPLNVTIELFESLPEGEMKRQAEVSLVRRMAQEDSDRAIEYIEATPLGRFRDQMINNTVFSILQERGIEAGMDFYDRIPNLGSNTGVAEYLADNWLRKAEPLDGINAAMKLQDVKKRDMLLSAIVGRWARKGPDGVDAWLETVSDPQLKEKLTVEAYRGLGQYDPVLAVQRAENLSAPEAKERVLQYAGQQWIQRDVFGAAEWVETLENGRLKDGLIHSLTNSVREDHPEHAFEWALKISDKRTRQSALVNVARSWAANNPEALNSKIKNSPLTDSESKALQGVLNR